VRRGVFDRCGDAPGVILSQSVGAGKHRQGAVRRLVDPDSGPDEVRPDPAGRQLQTQPPSLHRIVVADDAAFLGAEDA
jgi:hypothetical protein